MPTIAEDRARSRARRVTTYKSAPTILNEATRDFNSSKTGNAQAFRKTA